MVLPRCLFTLQSPQRPQCTPSISRGDFPARSQCGPKFIKLFNAYENPPNLLSLGVCVSVCLTPSVFTSTRLSFRNVTGFKEDNSLLAKRAEMRDACDFTSKQQLCSVPHHFPCLFSMHFHFSLEKRLSVRGFRAVCAALSPRYRFRMYWSPDPSLPADAREPYHVGLSPRVAARYQRFNKFRRSDPELLPRRISLRTFLQNFQYRKNDVDTPFAFPEAYQMMNGHWKASVLF